MKKWRRWLAWSMVVCTILCLAAAGLRGYAADALNRAIAAGFTPGKESPYLQGESMQDMTSADPETGVPRILSYWEKTFFLTGEEVLPCDAIQVTLKNPLHYYASPEDKEPACVLAAGDVVWVGGLPVDDLRGYGIYSLPTYETGWRYVRVAALAENVQELTAAALAEQPFCYIRAEEIDALYLQAYRQADPEWLSTRQNGFEQKYGRLFPITGLFCISQGNLYENSVQYCAQYMQWSAARETDWRLYNSGVYLSPDLTYPVLDQVNVLLLIAAGACIVTGAGLILWEKKRQKVSA